MEKEWDKKKSKVAHDSILLSRIVSEKITIKITFPDGEYLIDQLKWHTQMNLGTISGKVVNIGAVKYWEIVEE